MIAMEQSSTQSLREMPKPRDLVRARTTLQPQAYDENAMPSLRLTRSSKFARRVGRCLMLGLILGSILVAFAPWQQSVRGSGNVVGFSPQDRPQMIESPIKGRVSVIGDGIVENASVKAGQVIVEISDLDPEYLTRLRSQLDAKKSKVDSLEQLVAASERQLAANRAVAKTQTTQVETYRLVKDQMVAAAEAAIVSAQGKVRSYTEKLKESRAKEEQLKLDHQRQKTLFEEKIVSELKYQEAERKYLEAAARVNQAIAEIESAEADVIAKQRDRDGKEQKAQTDIDYAKSLLEKSEADIAKSESEVAKARSDMQTAVADWIDSQSKYARQQTQRLVAPFDGIVTQITPNLGSQMLKEGDPIAMIVPHTDQRAVQVWLDGNDANLVEPGREVRLQFEGWPAVQFAGWPSVAVGTFGGTIASIDATDNGKGQFRALVIPDEDLQAWPEPRFLRQGVRANGWVLLQRVPLWYELWRQINGFPPVLEKAETSKTLKAPKLPKA